MSLMAYENRIVVYLDILGFKKKLENEDALYEMSSAVASLSKNFENFSSSKGTSIYSFSDCLIITDKINKISSLPFFLLALGQRIATLFENRVIVRGAVSFGKYYEKEGANHIISPALVKAFELEQKYAIYPRVILDPNLMPLILKELRNSIVNETIPDLEPCLKLDTDGFKFIDFLRIRSGNLSGRTEYNLDHTGQWVSRKVEDYEFFKPYKRIIEENVKKSNDESVKAKYIWLGNYFNGFVSETYDKKELIIGKTDLSLY